MIIISRHLLIHSFANTTHTHKKEIPFIIMMGSRLKFITIRIGVFRGRCGAHLLSFLPSTVMTARFYEAKSLIRLGFKLKTQFKCKFMSFSFTFRWTIHRSALYVDSFERKLWNLVTCGVHGVKELTFSKKKPFKPGSCPFDSYPLILWENLYVNSPLQFTL